MKWHTWIRLIFFATLPVAALADEWAFPLPKVVYSEDGSFSAHITPEENVWERFGFCRVAFYQGDKELWSRNLINNVAPGTVLIPDSGRYLVTMDEWHNVGTLPIVIYGENGALLAVHNMESLGLQDDWRHILRTESSTWWNENAIYFFDSSGEIFFIRLHWGKWLTIGLKYGELLDEKSFSVSYSYKTTWEELVAFREKQLEKVAFEWIQAPEAGHKRAADAFLKETGREPPPALEESGG